MLVGMCSADAARSPYRRLPRSRSRTTSSVHLSPTRSSAPATGQVERSEAASRAARSAGAVWGSAVVSGMLGGPGVLVVLLAVYKLIVVWQPLTSARMLVGRAVEFSPNAVHMRLGAGVLTASVSEPDPGLP